jgi:hypothetical protein
MCAAGSGTAPARFYELDRRINAIHEQRDQLPIEEAETIGQVDHMTASIERHPTGPRAGRVFDRYFDGLKDSRSDRPQAPANPTMGDTGLEPVTSALSRQDEPDNGGQLTLW